MEAYVTTVPKRVHLAPGIYGRLLQTGLFDRVTLLCDTAYRGCWWNVKRAVKAIADSRRAALVISDDVLIDVDLFKAHALDLRWFLSDVYEQSGPHPYEKYGLVSLFSPPNKTYDRAREQGYNLVEHNQFMWAPCYWLDPDFADAVLKTDDVIDQKKAGQHDELRFRVASQLYEIPTLTVVGSLLRHDLRQPSILGTPPKIGNNVRDTRIMATLEDDFRKPRIMSDMDPKKTALREYYLEVGDMLGR